MFLDTLHELNAHVTQALLQAGLRIFPLPAGDTTLQRMEFVRPDYTTIVKEIPTHRLNISSDSVYHKTVSDWANTIVKFVLDAANEFAKPRIHMSNVYLNYDPKRQARDPVLHFDIAIWDYVDLEVQWLTVGHDDKRLGNDIGHHRPPPIGVETMAHTLLKQMPFEINVWTQNILRDVGFMTQAGSDASTLEYMIKLEQLLLAGARDASEVLQGMQRAAQVHDVVNALWRAEKYDEAADLVAQALKAPVQHIGWNRRHYLAHARVLFEVGQVFALVAGLTPENSGLLEDIEDEVDDEEPPTEEQRAADTRIASSYVATTHAEDVKRLMRSGVPLPSAAEFFNANDPAARLTGSLGVQITRADNLPEDVNDVASRPMHYKMSGKPEGESDV